MIAFRAINPLAIGLVAQDMIETAWEWYYAEMINNPEDVCLVLIMDGDVAVGHVAARIVNNAISGKRYAWVDSMKQDTDSHSGLEVLIQSKDALFDWCRERGVKQIRGEVNPGSKVFAKGIYGTAEHAKVFTKEID